jgi:hypothetical protein
MFRPFAPFAPFDVFRVPNLSDQAIPSPARPTAHCSRHPTLTHTRATQPAHYAADRVPVCGLNAGTGTLTHTRATSAWMWRDSDGRMWRDYAAGRTLIECPAGELRPHRPMRGARRAEPP